MWQAAPPTRPLAFALAAAASLLAAGPVPAAAQPAGAAQPSVGAPPPAPGAPTALARARPALQTYRLPNGLRVVLDEDHRAPTVALNVTYFTGSAHDPPEHPGLADLLERLLVDASTRHVRRDDRRALWEALGSGAPRSTSAVQRESTCLQTSVPANQLELALWVESDRMGFFTDGIDEAEVGRHRRRLQARFAEADEAQTAQNAVLVALFGAQHPYARLAASRAPLAAPIDAGEVRARARSRYGVANAALIVTGDFVTAAAKEAIARYFGPLVSAPAPAPSPPPAPEPALAAERRIVLEGSRADARVLIAWRTARWLEPADLALDGAAHVLRSRLDARLVDGSKIATRIEALQASAALASWFRVVVHLAPEHTADEALREVDDELAKLSSTEPSAAEVRAASLFFQTRHLSALDDLDDRSAELAAMLRARDDPAYAWELVRRYAGLSASDIRAAVASQLPRDKRVVSITTPARAAPKPGGAASGGSW